MVKSERRIVTYRIYDEMVCIVIGMWSITAYMEYIEYGGFYINLPQWIMASMNA